MFKTKQNTTFGTKSHTSKSSYLSKKMHRRTATLDYACGQFLHRHSRSENKDKMNGDF